MVVLLLNYACSDKDVISKIFDHSFLSENASYIFFLGDTQMYFTSDNNTEYYSDIIEWIKQASEKGYDVAAVLNPGDVTNDNTNTEWQRFSNVMMKADLKVPVIYSPGNHDYLTLEQRSHAWDRSLPFYEQYISYPDSIVLERFGSGIANLLFQIRVQNQPWYVLSLEFGPRIEVLEWAAILLQDFDEYPVILLTHVYLYDDINRYHSNTVSDYQEWAPSAYFPEAGDGQDIWDHLVKDNNQVKIVLCGHNFFSAKVDGINEFGNDVLQLRFDPTNQPNGGDGWMQVLEFKTLSASQEGSIELKGMVYNPIYNIWKTDVDGNFEFIID